MTACRYSLHVRPPGDLIVTTLAGFFSLPEVSAYTDEAEALIARCVAGHGAYRILIDISECAIQSQEVTAAFGRHITRVPRSKRVAVVTRSPIIRMQIRRIVGRPELAQFEHLSEALAWIEGHADAPSVPPAHMIVRHAHGG